MKTMVQSFLVEEAKELIYDTDAIESWKAKCQELGLEKQLELAQPGKSPVPFEYMNTVSQRVYETLCPTKSNYRDYRKTAIPLEVLSLIALAVQEGYFAEIEVWYDDKTPDPLVVGKVKKGAYTYDQFLIARWGDVLQPFEKLKEKAIKVYHRSSQINLKAKIADYTNKLAVLDNSVQQYFDCQADEYTVVGF